MARIQHFLAGTLLLVCGLSQAQIDPGQYYGTLSFLRQNFQERPNLPDRVYRLADVTPNTFVYSNEIVYVLTKGGGQSWTLHKDASLSTDLPLPMGEYQVMINGFRLSIQIEPKKTIRIPLSQVLVGTSTPWAKALRLVNTANPGAAFPEAGLNQAIVYPSAIAGLKGQFDIVVRYAAGSENLGENFVHIGLSETSGVQSIDLQEHTTRFAAPQIGSASLPDWTNFSRSNYEISNPSGAKQRIPYDSRSLYYFSHDHRLVSLRIGSEAILPRSGNCYEFYLNSNKFSECLTSGSSRLNLGRVEVKTSQGGAFKLFKKKPDGSFEDFLGQDIGGNFGLPVAPGAYLIRIYEKSGDYLVEELVQEINVERGKTFKISSPMIPTGTLEARFMLTPQDPFFQRLPSNPAYWVGGPRGRVPYNGGRLTVFRESIIQAATLLSGQSTQLKPGSYTLWVSGSQLQLKVDADSQYKISMGRIGIAKNQDTTDKSIFFVAQVLDSGETKALFDPDLAIPFGYFVDALPGNYEVTVCPFGTEQSCQKIPYTVPMTW